MWSIKSAFLRSAFVIGKLWRHNETVKRFEFVFNSNVSKYRLWILKKRSLQLETKVFLSSYKETNIKNNNLSDISSNKMPKRNKSLKFEKKTPATLLKTFFDDISLYLSTIETPLSVKTTLIRLQDGINYWSCQFKIRWPEEKIFSIDRLKKKDATNAAAMEVVQYLVARKLMNNNGKPLLKETDASILTNIKRGYCLTADSNHFKEDKYKAVLIENIEEIQKPSKQIAVLFTNPKHVLHNVYNTVKQEKQSTESYCSVQYKNESNNKWLCCYKITWPESKEFQAVGSTKKIASKKCSLEVLNFLYKNGKITSNGSPIIYEKGGITKLTKSLPTIELNGKLLSGLEEIVNLHHNKILPIFMKTSTVISKSDSMESLDANIWTYKQRFLGYQQYKCKESIHLPISDYKEKIIDLVRDNRVVIVKGEPGCGKSTRIPQYILEGWAREAGDTEAPCRIVVTEPRRIAAVSLAQRVCSERHEVVGSIVGYQVRFDSNFQTKTGRLLYCSNGILLQKFKHDPNLSSYTHVIIDEAHERDINTDLLLNMLKRVLQTNPNFKVIIMSATIDTDLFQNYFSDAATIHIPGFTYPVKSHFIDHCKLNLEKTKNMCVEGQQPMVIHDEVAKVLLHLHKEKPEGAILCFLPGWEDIRKVRNLIPTRRDVSVLCLHSKLQDVEQKKIFGRPPAGVRKIILSTNIAETSVTIDDVVYVVDTGIHKQSVLDVSKGVMCIDNYWISKSSVDQRKGRAGRVQPGECFHLYLQSKMDSFVQFSIPEILRISLTKVVLDSKKYSENSTASEFFSDMPSPPAEKNVNLAVNELKDLELIDGNEKLTPLGEVVVDFQLEPKLSKTLVNSVIYKCVSPIIDIVTLFSSSADIFTQSLDGKEQIRLSKAKFCETSDHLSMMRIYEIWDDYNETGNKSGLEKFCKEMSLNPSRLFFLNALRDMHKDYLYDGLKSRVLPISDDFSDEDEIVKAVLLSGVGTFLTQRNWEVFKGKMRKGNSLFTRLNHKATLTPESVNYKYKNLDSMFLLYINETRSNVRGTTLIRETSVISPMTLLLFSNKKLAVENITKENFSPNLSSNDQVTLNLVSTNIKFLLDRKEALAILQCKLVLSSCYEHYVYQLTKGGEHNEELNDYWNQVLLILSDLLRRS